jgi:hypothetical protein
MLSFRKRVSQLLERTSSIECKQVCKETVDMFQSVPEDQISSALVEKLKGINDSDTHVARFVNTAEKLQRVKNLGIAKGIGQIKVTETFHYPALRYAVEKIERQLVREQQEEYTLAEEFLNTFKDFVWDSNISTVLENVRKNIAPVKEEVLTARAIKEFSQNKGNFMFEKIVEKLENHFENPTEASRAFLVEELSKFTFNPTAKRLLEQLRKIQVESGKVQMVAENANCEIHSIYSPIINESGNEHFYVKGTFFKKKGDFIERVAKENASQLSESFRNLCSIFDQNYFSIKENKAIFYVGRNKVEILESDKEGVPAQVFFNSKPIAVNELAKNLVSTGMLRLEEANTANQIQKFAENIGNVYNLDFAKVIVSRVNENCYATLMKSGDNICVQKVNPLMGVDDFYTGLNATQARNIILEYLGYDIKESMEEYLEKEEREINALKEALRQTVEKMVIVEGEISKVDSVLAKDPYLASNSDLKNLRTMLDGENAILRKEHSSIVNKIKILESKPSNEFEAGDDVKIVSSGEVAKVNSVNGATNKVNVTTGDGKTKNVAFTDLVSIEKEVAKVTEAEENEEEEEEKEKKPIEKEETEETPTEIAEIPVDDTPIADEPAEPDSEPGIVDEEPLSDTPAVAEEPIVPTDASTATPSEEYVRATVSGEQQGPLSGKEVEVKALDMTTKGDEDMVDIKCDGEVCSIEKKFLTIIEEPVAGSETPAVPTLGTPSILPNEVAQPAEDDIDVHDTEKLKAWLGNVLGKLEDIKTDMKDTFVSNDSVLSTISSVRGMLDALKKDTGETTELPAETVAFSEKVDKRAFSEYAALITETNRLRDSIIALDVPNKAGFIAEFNKGYALMKSLDPEIFAYINSNENVKQTLDKTFKLAKNTEELSTRLKALPANLARVAKFFKKDAVNESKVFGELANELRK